MSVRCTASVCRTNIRSYPTRPDITSLVEGRFVEGMVFCVESLIGEQDAGECVKLETQVVVTASRGRTAG